MKHNNTDTFLAELGIDEPPNTAPLARRPKFKEWTYDELVDLPESQWLIGDEERPVLIAKGLWLNFGLFKSGKTYHSMEQAFCIAFGLDFHGLPVTQGNVAYVIAEGGTKRNLKRLLALCEKYDLPPEELNTGKFNLITAPVNLAAPNGVDELLKELCHHPYVAVWLDTWARMLSASGGHDTDPDTVGPAIQGCDRIRETLGCTVTIVAHVGWSKTAQDRPKGLVDLPGAIDGATMCKKDGDGPSALFRFKSMYQRHAADGFEQLARLEEFGPDRVFVSAPVKQAKIADLGPDQRRMLELLRGLGAGTSIDDWRKAVQDAGLWANVKKSTWRSKWQRAKDALQAADLIDVEGQMVSLNDQ